MYILMIGCVTNSAAGPCSVQVVAAAASGDTRLLHVDEPIAASRQVMGALLGCRPGGTPQEALLKMLGANCTRLMS
jgi:hypothetical protein